ECFAERLFIRPERPGEPFGDDDRTWPLVAGLIILTQRAPAEQWNSERREIISGDRIDRRAPHRLSRRLDVHSANTDVDGRPVSPGYGLRAWQICQPFGHAAVKVSPRMWSRVLGRIFSRIFGRMSLRHQHALRFKARRKAGGLL